MTDVLRPLPVERRFPLACTRVAVTTESRGQGGRFAEAEFHEPIARRRLTPSRMPKSPRSMPDQEPTSATGGSVLSRRNWVRLIPALTGDAPMLEPRLLGQHRMRDAKPGRDRSWWIERDAKANHHAAIDVDR